MATAFGEFRSPLSTQLGPRLLINAQPNPAICANDDAHQQKPPQ
jgi:hypothetical protein